MLAQGPTQHGASAAWVLAALAPWAAAACEDLHVVPFIASRWNPDQECLEPSGTVDVVEREDPKECDRNPRCWISPEGDLFATTECEGAPGWEQTTVEEDERCDDAIDAFIAGSEGRCEE